MDLGGPTREFFTLLLYDFKKSDLNMFEGQGGYLLSVCRGIFPWIWKTIVISALHGGPGFPFFPPFVLTYFRWQEYEHELSTLFIEHSYIKDYIGKVYIYNKGSTRGTCQRKSNLWKSHEMTNSILQNSIQELNAWDNCDIRIP